MITFVPSVLGALSSAEVHPVSSAGRRLAARLHLVRLRQGGNDIVAVLIHQILEDPDQRSLSKGAAMSFLPWHRPGWAKSASVYIGGQVTPGRR